MIVLLHINFWWIFFLSVLCFLFCDLHYNMKSVVLLIIPQFVICNFFFFVFRIFYFPLNLNSLTMICLGVVFFIFSQLRGLNALLRYINLCFSPHLKNIQPLSSSIFLSHSLFLLRLRLHVSQTSDIVPHITKVLLIFFLKFFLLFVSCTISVDLSLSSLTFFSVICSFLLSQPRHCSFYLLYFSFMLNVSCFLHEKHALLPSKDWCTLLG